MMSNDGAFTKRELQRVGTAVLLMAVLGTIIIIGMTIAMGHYNGLAHAGPKAVIDGIAIGLLIGARGRWRLLALLGIVYGLVLLVQVGLLYLLPIMTLAGILAAATGKALSAVHRATALAAAAACYELVAGTGGAVRIVFGTRGDEPLIWALWCGELGCRVAGGLIGVIIARRMTAGWTGSHSMIGAGDIAPRSSHHRSDIRQPGRSAAALRLAVLVVATVLPLAVANSIFLSVIAGLAIAYALWAGLRRQIVGVLMMFVFGWVVFAGLSLAWHRDMSRATELLQSLVLRFLPMTLSAAVLVETTRGVDLIRLFRSLGLGAMILLPLSHVVRQAPVMRREWFGSLHRLRQGGERFWLIRRPRETARLLIGRPFYRIASQLIEA